MKNPTIPETRSFTDIIKEGTTPGIERQFGRRDFLKIAALSATGILLPNCAHTTKVDALPGYEVYNKPNPNYKGKALSFYDILTGRFQATPGIEFLCNSGTPMIAAVDGFVMEVHHLEQHRGDAVMAVTQPEKKGKNFPWWATYYGHLTNLQVKEKDNIKRGQLIGYAVTGGYGVSAKLMAREAPGGIGTEYWVDPDNYGKGHGQLDYWDGKTDLSVANYIERSQKQQKILEQLLKMCNSTDAKYVAGKRHLADMNWSIIEKVRYLEQLQKRNPEKFSGDKQEIQTMIQEFYANQPVILTMPLKKA
ncbi:MAG: peptidoglycan DD-metalloendopeptidase family protein [Candidatus Woesearchaeota archaeon]